MRFGVCCGVDQATRAKELGWDYIEFGVQAVLKGQTPDDQWQPPGASFPMPAANVLVPGAMKITGPDVDLKALDQYMERVTRRARQVGCDTLVFGSGVARMVPEGFDRNEARKQILAFLSQSAVHAKTNGVTIVIEPLNRGECNIINGVVESLTYVRELAHPNVKQLVDTYHLWLEQEPLSAVRDAGSLLRHVHVADRDGRVPPGLSGQSDYRGLFRILKEINYDLRVSVECSGWDWDKHGTGVLSYLKDQYAKA
jgi:sugar phosphate isomerase/epimerase